MLAWLISAPVREGLYSTVQQQGVLGPPGELASSFSPEVLVGWNLGYVSPLQLDRIGVRYSMRVSSRTNQGVVREGLVREKFTGVYRYVKDTYPRGRQGYVNSWALEVESLVNCTGRYLDECRMLLASPLRIPVRPVLPRETSYPGRI